MLRNRRRLNERVSNADDLDHKLLAGWAAEPKYIYGQLMVDVHANYSGT
jgi:hypothetical protein